MSPQVPPSDPEKDLSLPEVISQGRPVCRVIPYSEGDGATNMARDETLLDLVGSDPSMTVFRTYGWTQPTLSLGYFQSYADALKDPRWRDVPIVRRPTGGGAIWHDRELTYALALPGNHPLASNPNILYETVHAQLASCLDIPVDPLDLSRPSDPIRPFLCFNDRSVHDVLIRGHKIIGSAQRRRRGVVLQHGSILMRRSDKTPEFPGSEDLVQKPTEARSEWVALLSKKIPLALGFTTREMEWSESDVQTTKKLEREIYRTERWTKRR